jgi:hypothetical protein
VSRDTNLYEILGVSPTSESVVIEAAYRALMRRYQGEAATNTDVAAKVQRINAAYSTLGNARKRANYDAGLRGGPPREKVVALTEPLTASQKQKPENPAPVPPTKTVPHSGEPVAQREPALEVHTSSSLSTRDGAVTDDLSAWASEQQQSYEPGERWDGKSPSWWKIGWASLLVLIALIIVVALVEPELTPSGRPAEPASFVVAQRTNVRTGPTTEGSEIVGTVAPGDRIQGQVVQDGGEAAWVKISSGRYAGRFVWMRNLESESELVAPNAVRNTASLTDEVDLNAAAPSAGVEPLAPEKFTLSALGTGDQKRMGYGCMCQFSQGAADLVYVNDERAVSRPNGKLLVSPITASIFTRLYEEEGSFSAGPYGIHVKAIGKPSSGYESHSVPARMRVRSAQLTKVLKGTWSCGC